MSGFFINGNSLPLVLVTVGEGVGEFETLYEHLESLAREPVPTQLSLIVARPELPKVLYKMLRIRTKEMPNVFVRRLHDDIEDCAVIHHQAGRFYPTPKR